MTAPSTPHPLDLLTSADWALLEHRMQRQSCRRGEVLMQEGVRRRALVIVRSGSVRVERAARGRALVLSQLGPGEVLGDIGFVEDAPASASVVAEDACTVDVVEGDALQSLIAADAGFGARFYHSLAISMARRMRAADRARLASAHMAAAAQLSRFHVPHTGNLSARQIPPALSDALETFEQTMLVAKRALRHGATEASQAASVGAACNTVIALLRTYTASEVLTDLGYSDLLAFRDPEQLEAGVGDCVFRETFSTFMLSATMARCYAKPRGFSDDFETLAMVLRNRPEGDDRLGPLIDRWFLDRPLCRSRRADGQRLLRIVQPLAARRTATAPLHVAVLASGAAAELFALFEADPSLAMTATCIDLDEEALLAGARRAEAALLGERITFVQGNVVPGLGHLPALLPHDVVYALGLCEMLDDDQVVELLDVAWTMLRPGGFVVLTNLAQGNPDQELMVHLLDWQAHHRSEPELRALVRRSAFAGRPADVQLDASRASWLVQASKPV